MSWVQAHAGSPHSTQKQLQEHHVLLPAESHTLAPATRKQLQQQPVLSLLHESSSTKCYTKAALGWVELCELCELWDEFCERTWVKFSERTRKQLHQMPHESSSWVSWVVWDELSEMSCVSWVVRDELCEMSYVSCERRGVVWDELCALCERTWVKLSERRSKWGGEGGEGAECRPKNKKPTEMWGKKTHSDELCDDIKKKQQREESCYRDTMTKSHRSNVHRRPTFDVHRRPPNLHQWCPFAKE